MFYDNENLNNNINYHSLNFDEYIPDVNLKNPEIIDDLEIQITEIEKFYKVEVGDLNLTFEPEELDIDLNEFSQKNQFININQNSNNIKWENQSNFIGSFSDDKFLITKDTLNDNNSIYFESTPGSDIYLTSNNNLNILDYSNLEDYNTDLLGYKVDVVTGLEIFDKENYSSLDNDYSPLLANEFFNDPLIINKNDVLSNIDIDQIDILEEIDFIRFTPNDDTFYLNNIRSTNIYDFISGDDKVIYRSADLPTKLTNLINLDKFIWETNSNPETTDNYEFNVRYINEDTIKDILIEQYDSNNFNEKLPDQVNIEYFSKLNISSSDHDLSWLDAKLVDPTPEIINQGKPVIQQKFVQDSDIEDLFWLEIHIFDYRSFGKGFIGADIDLEWDSNSILLDTDLYDFENVFGVDKLPIFQNLGDINISDQFDKMSSIKGITAGSLPVASQGVLLGDIESDNLYTTFARIPFRNSNLSNVPKFNFTLNSLPASKAISVEKSDVIIIDEHSPKALVLRGSPEQGDIGSHFIKIISGEEYDFDEQNIVINVNSINDAPVPLIFNNETSPLKVDLFQNENYVQDLSSLFTDDDNLNLIYEIVSAPDWVSLLDDNTLSGTPINNDVGLNSIVVSASDGFNEPVMQTISVNVLNINDAPEVIRQLELPDIEQGVNFKYTLTENSFFDKDTLVTDNEELSYSLTIKNSSDQISKLLSIDAKTGDITVTTDYSSIGETEFLVTAIDKEGSSAQLLSKINVLNINDSPFLTDNIPNFVDPIIIDFGEEFSIDVNDWFNDYDLGYDKNEKLTFNVWEDDGSGTLIPLNNVDNWVSFNEETKLLNIKPSSENIGKNFIVVTAADNQGLEASATIPITVKYKNNSPNLNYKEEDLLIQNIKFEGVESIETGIGNNDEFIDSITFFLEEQSKFEISLPFDLFNDVDSGVDPNETLTFKLEIDGETVLENELFEFDSSSLVFNGNTTDLGLDSLNGSKDYIAKLIISDNYGLQSNLDLLFKIQRTIEEPKLIVSSDLIEVDESKKLKLSELFKLQHPSVEGEKFNIFINELDTKNKLILVNSNNLPFSNQVNSGENTWVFSGTFDEVITQIENVYVKTSSEFEKGNFRLGFQVNSYLGETGLQTTGNVLSKDYKINAIPNLPIWNIIDSEIESLNPFSLTELSRLFYANSPDNEEDIFYLVNFPLERTDLFITNVDSQTIGRNTNSGILLTSDEWENSHVRTNTNNFDEFEISLIAISKENSNEKQIQTPIEYKKLTPSAFLEIQPVIDFQLPVGVQTSGQISKLSVFTNIPSAANSIVLSIDLPSGSTLDSLGDLLNPLKSNISIVDSNTTKYQFVFDTLSSDFPDEIEVFIKTEESFNGVLEGNLEILASSRSAENLNFDNESKLIDISKSFSSASDLNSFNWKVIQIASLPEFNDELSFNPNTGELSIGIRRGVSSLGFRNPNEAISLSIANIPNGYSLAEKINSEYRSIGAKDKFGTITLFNTPKFEGNNINGIEEFEFINNGNLYIVANDANQLPFETNLPLKLSISSLISGQEGGDSRSGTNSAEIDLPVFVNSENIPFLKSSLLTIDPLIINVENGELGLISVNESNDLKFAMIPETEPLSTGWLDKESNLGKNTTAFLALNDDANDSNDDIEINSITELFSEYFQSDNSLRTYLSGISALKSLDSDGNLIINSDDLFWEDILLWFDDGDAKSSLNEIYNISDYINNIDLNSYELLQEQPDWNSGNQIIGSINATDNNLIDKYQIFDVGLTVNPSESSSIDIEIENNINDLDLIEIKENGENIKFSIRSSDSSRWINEGLDEFTLIRLSGLPKEITPSLGVKDSRGDWLFTWADLNKNGGEVTLFAPPFWSGNSNLNFLVSQLQTDGSLLNSSIISYGLEVESEPTKPIFRVKDLAINEDEDLKLIDMISIAKLVDNDGSEELHFEIEDSSSNFYIYELGPNNIKSKQNSQNNIYKFNSQTIDDFYISPINNFSGPINLNWKAVSIEKDSNSRAENTGGNVLYIKPVADEPLPIESINQTESLIQGETLILSKIVNVANYNIGLQDNDGSEELIYEIELPLELSLRNYNDENWIPISNITLDNKNVYQLKGEDLQYLEIKDDNFANDLFNVAITRISREILNGDESKSLGTNIEIPFHKNALPAEIEYSIPQIEEDSQGIILSTLFNISPSNSLDNLSYKIRNINNNLQIVNLANNEIYNSDSSEVIANNLNELIVRPITNISGKFSFDISVISIPQGRGNSAETEPLSCIVDILAIADNPILYITTSVNEKIEIKDNGWADIYELGLKVLSDDDSEEYSILINSLNEKDEIIPLPNQINFNTPHQILDGNTIEIKNKDLNNLSIYFNQITEDLNLQLTPKSDDSGSIKYGEEKTIIIKANLEEIIVKVPLLQVSGSIQGYEDEPIPLLSNIGGVISSQHRDEGIGQSLFLDVNNLPNNSKIVKLIGNDNGENIFSSPLNFNDNGSLNTFLRLPYEKWSDVYLLMPKNSNGEFEFNVRAISVGDKNLEEKTTQNLLVRTILTPVNDAPLIVNFDDLEKANEGEIYIWNLKNRFSDIDNNLDDLFISVKFKNDNGIYGDLPEWLTLDENGILISNANNDNVGIYSLLIKAFDPLGGETEQEVQLEIGNINQDPFIANFPSGWTDISDGTIKEFQKNITLNDSHLLSLNNIFDDIDLRYGDTLTFQISEDGIDWKNDLENLASISFGMLSIKPVSKEKVGNQSVYLRAVDQLGSKITIRLSINVININEPPTVNRSQAVQIHDSLWEEEIDLLPDKTNLNLDLSNLFIDSDLADTIEEIYPILPSWLEFDTEAGKTGGVLRGIPKINDIGQEILNFNAFDQSGKIITFRLKLNVQNVNDPPVLVDNPDLSSLGEIINGVPNVLQNSYSRLNPGLLFDDEDFPYGDSLSYNLLKIAKIENEEEIVLENTDWINLSYKTSEKPDPTDKFLIEPIFFIEDANREFSQKVDINDLSDLAADSRIKVIISALDNRIDQIKGLVGLDLDVVLSNSLELVDQTINISDELPLFNKIITQRKGFRVEAGSAPDLGIGGSVGDLENEELISFEAILRNPELKIMVSLTPGMGEFRDGITTRGAQTLDLNNSVIHSITNQEGADIEILAPNNESVGLYKVYVEATDQSGESTVGNFLINIDNLNEAPIINNVAFEQIQTYLNDPIKEKELRISDIFSLFEDPDTLHGDELNLEMFFDNGNYFGEFNNTIDSISIQSDSKGNIKVKLEPPMGLLKDINPVFSISATDKDGLNVISPLFQANFLPVSEISILTKGLNKENLRENSLGMTLNKNMIIDLGKTLNINAPVLTDTKGDELFLNLEINSLNSSLFSDSLQINNFVNTTKNNDQKIIHRINLSKLREDSNSDDLDGIKLSVDPNTFSKIPSELITINANSYGIPIKIWTSTRVVGDVTNKFGIEESPKSSIWIPIRNSKPVFLPSRPININNNFFNENGKTDNTLFNLSENFYDSDLNDTFSWEVKVPEELAGLVRLDSENGAIILDESIKDFNQLPIGNHRIRILAKDSSYNVGDLTAKVKGILRVNIVDNINTEELINGLTLINKLSSNDIKEIFTRYESNQSLLSEENDLINIFKKLNRDETSRDKLIDKISNGSATILNNSEDNMPLVLLDSIAEDELLLLSAKQEEVSEDDILESMAILESKNYVESPVGKLEFSIDTNDKPGAYVDIYLESGGLDIDELIKTTINNESYLYQTKIINYDSEVNGDFETWLKSLNYNLNNYLTNEFNLGSLKRSDDFENINIPDELISSLDGSAYLIDKDNNGTIDVISMLLLDQGFFDTDTSINVIGDPLIPIETELIPDSNYSSSQNINSQNTSPVSNQYLNNNFLNDETPISKNNLFISENEFNKISNANSLNINDQKFSESSRSNNFRSLEISNFKNSKINNYSENNNLIEEFKNNLSNLKESINGFFEEFTNNQFFSILGILFIPALGERIVTPIAKNLDFDYKLNLMRRSNNFTGKWIFETSRGKSYTIVRNLRNIELHPTIKNEKSSNLKIIEGFDLKKESLLFKAFLLSSSPGLFIEEMSKIQRKFLFVDTFEVNWQLWLKDNLLQYIDQENKYNRIICRNLTELINRTNKKELCETDIVMFAHIIDCCDNLNISKSMFIP